MLDPISFQTRKCQSSLPIPSKYKHWKTICEHTLHNSPTTACSSSLNLCSSKERIETLYHCSVFSFCLIGECKWSFLSPIFLTHPVRGQFVPDAPTIVPPTLMLPSRVVARVVSLPFWLRGLSPLCTCPSEDAFHGVDHRIGSFIADPSHGSPHTFSNPFVQKRQSHLYQYLLAVCKLLQNNRPCFFFVFSNRKRRSIVLVSRPLILSMVCTVHVQFSLPKEKMRGPWDVFTLVRENIFPKRPYPQVVGTLHCSTMQCKAASIGISNFVSAFAIVCLYSTSSGSMK